MVGRGCNSQVRLWGLGRRRKHWILKHRQNVERRRKGSKKCKARESGRSMSRKERRLALPQLCPEKGEFMWNHMSDLQAVFRVRAWHEKDYFKKLLISQNTGSWISLKERLETEKQ